MKHKALKCILIGVYVTFPIISALLLLYVFLGGSVSTLYPCGGDEPAWFLNTKATINSFFPMGYFGYNGVHAKIGTADCWGWAMALPDALIGKIFGWKLNTYFWIHIFYMMLGNVIFLVCIRPKKKSILYLCTAELFLVLNEASGIMVED